MNEIDHCTKPKVSGGGGLLPENLAARFIGGAIKTKRERIYGRRMDRIKKILAKVLAHLEYCGEIIETKSSPKPPAETKNDITPAKRRGVLTWVKGLVRELYGLTIERITKAYLDKYG